MTKDIKCHDGECHELKGKNTYFDDLFPEGNIVEQIEKDIWENNLYGQKTI